MAEFKISRIRYTWKGGWVTSTPYIKDDVVEFSGSTWVCIRQHTASAFASDQLFLANPGDTAPTPAWQKMSDGYAWKDAWQTGQAYGPGDITLYGGALYLCTESHIAGSQFATNNSKWAIYAAFVSWKGDWLHDHRYGVGDVVRYGGKVYQCIIEHTASSASNGLQANQNSWQLYFDGVTFAGEWSPSVHYKVNDLVKYGGSILRCSEEHTSTPSIDSGKFTTQFFGFKIHGEWDSTTYYAIGDVVQHGGYIYRADANNQNSSPQESIYQPIVSNWTVVSKSNSFKGEWNSASSYNTGDVVRRGGCLFVALLDSTDDGSSVDYLDDSNWELIVSADAWKDGWQPNVSYGLGDISKFQGTVYRCTYGHISSDGNFPGDNGNGFNYWEILLISGDGSGTSNRGDILTYNLSRTLVDDGSSLGQTGAPIGQADYVTSIDANDTIYYKVWGNTPKVRYVSSDDTIALDDATDPDRGINPFKPWRTIRFATEQVEAQGINSAYTTIQISAGKYEEVLPIIVPANVALLGNEIRSVTVTAKPANPALVADSAYTIDVLGRISSVLSNFVLGIPVVPTSGNTAEQVLPTMQGATGSGASVNVISSNDVYTSYVVSFGGTGYRANDIIKLLGTDLGGTAANNLYLKVTSASALGQILTVEKVFGNATGTGVFLARNASNVDGVGSLEAITDAQDLIVDISNYIDFHINGIGSNPVLVGTNTASTNPEYENSVTLLQANKEWFGAEAVAYMKAQHGLYTFDSASCARDVSRFIDAICYDLIYTGNYKSLLAGRYYRNAVLGSENEDMFYVRNSTGIRNMTLQGLTGTLATPTSAVPIPKPTGGAFVSLDPGWGPADERTWITSRSCYVQNVTTFGYGAVGQKIDGALHNGGNKSIVSNDFTQIISDGIGAYVLNGGRAELVSVFTYYSQIGMFAENGGIIRATNGNSSYGTFGALADGNDPTEVPRYGYVNNRTGQALVKSAFAGEKNDEILIMEFSNAGQQYTNAAYNIVGSGTGARVVQEEFRDNGVFEMQVRTPPGDRGATQGGLGYIVAGNNAQTGGPFTITLASNDENPESYYLGMRIIITSGDGTGQYGYVTGFNTLTKVMQVSRESDNKPGWDHVIPGTPPVSVMTTNATYKFEPRLTFAEPPFTAQTVTMSDSRQWADIIYGETTEVYNDLVGTIGLGSTINVVPAAARWDIVKVGRKYTVSLIYAGAGYQDEQTIIIDGAEVGGISGENDIHITVTSVSDDSTNSIVTFSFSGIAQSGKFVVTPMLGGTAQYSSDGLTWKTASLPTSREWKTITWGNNQFLTLGFNSASGAVSSDGVNWTPVSLPSTHNWTSSVYGNGLYVAIATDQNAGAFSTDGINWSPTTLPTVADSTYNEWIDIAYGKEKFVVIANSNNIAAVGTYNGVNITWTGTVMDVIDDSTQRDWVGVAYGNSRFVAIAATGQLAYSFDGLTWYPGDMPTQDGSTKMTWTSISYGQGVFLATSTTGNAVVAGDPTTGPTTFAATSYDGIVWKGRELSTELNWKHAAFGNPDVTLGDSTATNSSPRWVVIPSDVTNVVCLVQTGARALGRAIVEAGSIKYVKIWEPGSGYTTAPSFTIYDPNSTETAFIDPRIGDGVLAQPTWITRGTNYRTSSTVVTVSGDGYSDIIPNGQFVTISGMSILPGPGAQFRFRGETNYFTVATIEYDSTASDGLLTAVFRIGPILDYNYNLEHNTQVEIRERYSQVRITGHDFLDVGTGNFENSMYPELYSLSTYTAAPENEVVEKNGGRVFYTSTDQSGNFRTGELFAVEQATGIVTISAEFFNLQGLTELALGGVRLGGSGAVVREFSTDPLFIADSNNVVPTQRAIKAYLSTRLNIGGSDLLTTSFVAGTVKVGPNLIDNSAGLEVLIPVKVVIDGPSQISGSILAQTMFFRSFNK